MGTLSKLRRLVLRDNVSVREAARRLNISRNTAKKYLDQSEMAEPRYAKRQSLPGLDPFKEQLRQWLKTDTHCVPCTKIFVPAQPLSVGQRMEMVLGALTLEDGACSPLGGQS